MKLYKGPTLKKRVLSEVCEVGTTLITDAKSIMGEKWEGENEVIRHLTLLETYVPAVSCDTINKS